jgi:DNA gyrase subunit A
LRLQRLTGMEREKIHEEYESIMKVIAHLKELLSNEGMRYDLHQRGNGGGEKEIW